MAGGRKGGSQFVLESRHLAGLFMLLVTIFGMVFTLGYMLGRSQYDSRLRAAATSAADADLSSVRKTPGKPEAAKPTESPAAPTWDFYHSAESNAPQDHVSSDHVTSDHAPGNHVGGAPKPAAHELAAAAKTSGAVLHSSPKNSPPLNASLVPKGAIMLQVAALKSEGDALALAQALQQKKFPAFVIPPGTDSYYHVQVGPYSNAQGAAAGRSDLEAHGFKSIPKR